MVKQNKGHWVTPFWHNDAHSRVTVTFGARRGRRGPDFRLGSQLVYNHARLMDSQAGWRTKTAGNAPQTFREF